MTYQQFIDAQKIMGWTNPEAAEAYDHAVIVAMDKRLPDEGSVFYPVWEIAYKRDEMSGTPGDSLSLPGVLALGTAGFVCAGVVTALLALTVRKYRGKPVADDYVTVNLALDEDHDHDEEVELNDLEV